MTSVNYVLVTPARNEADFIQKTIESVVAQTILPRKWVIVSDGSTDRTDEIVREFAMQHEFMALLRRSSENDGRSCGSKVRAFDAGYEQLRNIPHEFVGNLDADVSVENSYFEKLLARFRANPRLGIGGGVVHELIDGRFVPQRISPNSVPGAVQMFRRGCFERIGGYIPARYGGEDAAAEITARAHGWTVQNFPELEVRHYRPVSSGEGPIVRRKLRHGIGHYLLGYHPLFEAVRNASRLGQRPYVAGALLMSAGYLWAMTTRMKRELPDDVIEYLQTEQMSRLQSLFLARRRS